MRACGWPVNLRSQSYSVFHFLLAHYLPAFEHVKDRKRHQSAIFQNRWHPFVQIWVIFSCGKCQLDTTSSGWKFQSSNLAVTGLARLDQADNHCDSLCTICNVNCPTNPTRHTRDANPGPGKRRRRWTNTATSQGSHPLFAVTLALSLTLSMPGDPCVPHYVGGQVCSLKLLIFNAVLKNQSRKLRGCNKGNCIKLFYIQY